MRLQYPTEHLGFCITSMANLDKTFINMIKQLHNEKYKLAPTAIGKQLKMFVDETMLAVEPSTEYTYYHDKDMHKKILSSIETPDFIREFIKKINSKVIEFGSASDPSFQKWKKSFFSKKWLSLLHDDATRNNLIKQNHDSQKSINADILIPPTPPILDDSMLKLAIKIIDDTTKIYGSSSTAIYFNLPSNILKNETFRYAVLNYCRTALNQVIIIKIKNLDDITHPMKKSERDAYSDIQDVMCDIRKNNQKKCTILLNGGFLTIPSLIKGFDIVVNHISGKNNTGGFNPKHPSKWPGRSSYFIRDKLIPFSYENMIHYNVNQLRLTNNTHGLECMLPCCSDILSIDPDEIRTGDWNSLTRLHFCLTMNDIIKEIVRLIHTNQIEKAKDILMKSELCIFKSLLPDV